MLLSNKIKKLFNSSLSDYRIAKDTGIVEQSINDFHHHRRNLMNMSLKNAQILGAYYDRLRRRKLI